MGAIILPKSSPNFIHPKFKGVNILEFSRPRNKNNTEIISDHILILSPLKIGQKPIIIKL